MHQSTDRRGRVVTKVRFGLVQVLMNVPRTNFLKAWAADPHKRWPVDLISLNAATGQALETLHMNGAYCVFYREEFHAGDIHNGSYVLQVNLSDPDGFTITAGGPDAYRPAAAREHGTPPIAAAITPPTTPVATNVSTCPPDVTARLQMQVELACKTTKSKCVDTDSCPLLSEKMALFQACIMARETIMNQCFGGGDAGHKEQVQQRKNGYKKCDAIFKRQCVPRPEPSPVTVPVPSTSHEPDKQPEDHKTALATVATLIFVILTAPLRLSPP